MPITDLHSFSALQQDILAFSMSSGVWCGDTNTFYLNSHQWRTAMLQGLPATCQSFPAVKNLGSTEEIDV